MGNRALVRQLAGDASAVLSTSVHALETSGGHCDDPPSIDAHPLHVQSRAQVRLHAPYAKDRIRLVSALHDGPTDDHRRRAQRLGQCCCMPTLRRASTGAVGVDFARCRDRLCPMCSIARGREVRKRVLARTAAWRTQRFVTLTLAMDGRSLAERIDRLYKAFKRLRSEPVWKENVESGIAVCEITLGSKRQWHTHLHVLVSGEFIPHAQLKAAWHRVTGDSIIVHVRASHDRESAARYVADYMGKPPKLKTLTDEEICEYATATHGRRLLIDVGKRPESVSEEDDEPDTRGESKHLCNVNAIERAERQGHEHAGHAAEILSRMNGALAAVLGRNPPDPSLSPVTGQEFLYAVHVCEQIEQAFPELPDTTHLDHARCRFFGEPAPPPPSRVRQLQFQYAY